jgi:hypothetical protein
LWRPNLHKKFDGTGHILIVVSQAFMTTSPRPRKVSHLFQAYKQHQMELAAAYNIFHAACLYPYSVNPTAAEWQAVAEAAQQIVTQWPATIRQAIGNAFSHCNTFLADFILRNKFISDADFDIVCSANPLMAPLYGPGFGICGQDVCRRAAFVTQTPAIAAALSKAAAPVQQAFLGRLIQFLPDTVAGAAALTAALTAAPQGADSMLMIHVQHIPPLGWKTHLADALFNHSNMVPFFYKSYGPEYATKAASLLPWHELTQQSLRKWQAVDQRLVKERRRRTADNWRFIFWSTIVFQWRKREFLAHHYAPGGKGTIASAAHFEAAIALDVSSKSPSD